MSNHFVATRDEMDVLYNIYWSSGRKDIFIAEASSAVDLSWSVLCGIWQAFDCVLENERIYKSLNYPLTKNG